MGSKPLHKCTRREPELVTETPFNMAAGQGRAGINSRESLVQSGVGETLFGTKCSKANTVILYRCLLHITISSYVVSFVCAFLCCLLQSLYFSLFFFPKFDFPFVFC